MTQLAELQALLLGLAESEQYSVYEVSITYDCLFLLKNKSPIFCGITLEDVTAYLKEPKE